MNNPMMLAVMIESLMLAIMLAVLLYLARTLLKLKRDYRVLSDRVQANCNDIAGLCSAALSVDSRIATVDRQMVAADEQVNALAEKFVEAANSQQSTHPYSVDIRKVRGGASVNELMQESGLSHDEAALLIRLHGSKADSGT